MIGFAAERLMELEVQRLAGFFRRYELYLVVGDERERAFRLDGVAHPDACR